jgi:hypothetical protein
MAQYNSTQYASTITVPPSQLNPDALGGKVRALYCKHTTDASAGITTSDVLVLGKLPAGARVISAECVVPASFLTSASKLGYGTITNAGVYTAVDDDRWGVSIDLSSVGRKQFLIKSADMDYKTTGEVAIAWTPTTTTTGLALDISFVILYVVD